MCDFPKNQMQLVGKNVPYITCQYFANRLPDCRALKKHKINGKDGKSTFKEQKMFWKHALLFQHCGSYNYKLH